MKHVYGGLAAIVKNCINESKNKISKNKNYIYKNEIKNKNKIENKN